MRALLDACRQTAKLCTSHWRLWTPFLIVALVELIFIGTAWLAPFPPFSKVLAPPIRYFYGERVLHYPWHLWFLYHVMHSTYLLGSTLVGAYLTGAACVMVRQAREGRVLSLRAALVSRQVRYGRVLLVWLVTWALAKGIEVAIGHFAPKAVWVSWTAIGATFLLQSLLVYAIPFAVFQGSTWWRAIVQSAQETIRYPASTLAIVSAPSIMLILLGLAAPEARVAQWMIEVTPELALPFVAARLIVWTVADAILTVAIAHLWLLRRAPGAASARAKTLPASAKARATAAA